MTPIGPLDYEYETCADCGQPSTLAVVDNEPVTWWQAPDELWRAVWGGDDGVLCPGCFTMRACGRGISVRWLAERDNTEGCSGNA